MSAGPITVRIGESRILISPKTVPYIDQLLDIELLTDEWNATGDDPDKDADEILEEREQIVAEIEAIGTALKRALRKANRKQPKRKIRQVKATKGIAR